MMMFSPVKQHCKTIALSPVTLPDELIAVVLSFLNAKSLVRFKCVSKYWNSLISDPSFVKMHFIKSSRNPHMILFPSYYLNTSNIAIHNPFLILRSLLENPSVNLFPKDYVYELMKNGCYILGSCNGLACLVSLISLEHSRESEFYLWNPATRWMSPKLGSFHRIYKDSNSRFKFSFGYDNLTHKYKVVAFRPNDVRVLTLGDNIWKNIQSFPWEPPHDTCISKNLGVYLSNSLNWFTLRDNIQLDYYMCTDLSVQNFVIISLDLGLETYTLFRFPQNFDEIPFVPPTVCVLMECLCFSYYSSGYDFVIWQMKEFGVEESWTKLLKFDCENILHNDSYIFVNLLPLHVFDNGDMLIMALNLRQLICYSTIENRVVRQAAVTDSLCMDVLNVNHYVESLLSNF